MTWLLLALGCGDDAVGPELVRDGVILAGGAGRPVADGRVLLERPWKPGELVEGVVAPRLAGCARLFALPLGDVSALIAAGGEPPDTALAFSPDGTWLAVGGWNGDVLVVDGWTGIERARRHVAEGMVKRLAWSPDGSVLYAAEQSPDAFVYAFDAADLTERARFRMADDLGSSPAPGSDDPFGAYTLPGAYGLVALDDGVLVAGSHGWTVDGERRNRARLWRLGADLRRMAAWPGDGPADAVIGGMDHQADRVVVALRRSATGPVDAELPIDGALVLGLPSLDPRASVRIPPLAPLYSGVVVGDGLRLAGPDVWIGTGDGRVVRASAETGEILGIRDLGTPLAVGAVPVAATVGWLGPTAGGALVVTTRSAIPYGAASPDLRPPGLHPAENGIWELGSGDLATGWSWQGPWTLQGLARAGDLVVVGAGGRTGDDRRDLFGALVFDLRRPEPDRLVAVCSTPSPVFFRMAVSADGRIALAESPFRVGAGVDGAYRVSVWR